MRLSTEIGGVSTTTCSRKDQSMCFGATVVETFDLTTVVLNAKRWIGHISELFSFYFLGQFCVEFICVQNRAKRQVLPSRKMRTKMTDIDLYRMI